VSKRRRSLCLRCRGRAFATLAPFAQEPLESPFGKRPLGRNVDVRLYDLFGQDAIDPSGDQVALDTVATVTAPPEAVANQRLGKLPIVE